MKWHVDDQFYYFKSGRMVYTGFNKDVGIDEDLQVTMTHEPIDPPDPPLPTPLNLSRSCPPSPFTPKERIDVADTMIRCWQCYRNKALNELGLSAHMSFSGFIGGLIILSEYIDPSDTNVISMNERNIIQIDSFVPEKVNRAETEELINLGWVVDDDLWTWRL